MSKRKVILNPTELSSRSIKEREDFDQLLEQYARSKNPYFSRIVFWGTVGGAVVAGFLICVNIAKIT